MRESEYRSAAIDLSRDHAGFFDTAQRAARVICEGLIHRYDLNAQDARTFQRGMELLADAYWAAGAREVLVPAAGVPALRDGDSGPLRRREERLKNRLAAPSWFFQCIAGLKPSSALPKAIARKPAGRSTRPSR